MGGGPTKELWLGLRSTQKAAAPAADHDVPAGMNMGKALQPLGTAPVVGGRSPPDSGWAMRNAQLRWPNDRAPKTVPANASIKGEQFVHGSATPDIRFTIGDKQDFLAPFEATAKGSFPGPFALGWPAIAKAQGYFLQAMGHRESTGEMIIGTSSEVQDTGWGLMTWLPKDFLRRTVAEKVVLPPDVTNCTMPKDAFAGLQGAMVQTFAYGEELNRVHPLRLADPKIAWEQIWAVKVRVKSTGMVPLGMGDGDADAGRNRGRVQSQQQTPTQAPPESKPPNSLDDAADAVNKLKGVFKFCRGSRRGHRNTRPLASAFRRTRKSLVLASMSGNLGPATRRAPRRISGQGQFAAETIDAAARFSEDASTRADSAP